MNILGLCEMRWKNFGETTTEEGHKIFFSGKEDKHEHGVGFLVHKDIVNTFMGCRPVSSRLITIRLRAVPFNITVVQAYVPTSDYDNNKIEEFYDQLQSHIAIKPLRIAIPERDTLPWHLCTKKKKKEKKKRKKKKKKEKKEENHPC